jgi:hypothetical protein
MPCSTVNATPVALIYTPSFSRRALNMKVFVIVFAMVLSLILINIMTSVVFVKDVGLVRGFFVGDEQGGGAAVAVDYDGGGFAVFEGADVF